jgi:hypothetical protein
LKGRNIKSKAAKERATGETSQQRQIREHRRKARHQRQGKTAEDRAKSAEERGRAG